MRTRINELLKQTSEITGYSNEEVASVMNHCFTMVKEFLLSPYKAGLRLPYIGVLRTNTSLLNFYIRKYVIPRYKEGKMSKERFQAYWKLRELTRKDEERRNFKERYNLKFNPSWRQDTDSTEGDSGSHED